MPLVHSTPKQFLPILGRVCKPVETEPFVVVLWQFLAEVTWEQLVMRRGGGGMSGFIRLNLTSDTGYISTSRQCRLKTLVGRKPRVVLFSSRLWLTRVNLGA